MDELTPLPLPPSKAPSAWLVPAITAILGASAALYQGYNVRLGLDADDSNHLETPLALCVARQVTHGPGSLYGPFSGANPLVLIHAPLYYRLAAPAVWAASRWGIDPVLAALASGRLLSAAGMIALLLASGWIAGLDGASRRSRVWSVFLIAAAPVFGSFPATVRPDTMALAFQTLGFGFALRALRDGRGARVSDPIAACLLFGLAVCAKQHFVATAGVAVFLLIVANVRRRGRPAPFLIALLLGAALVVGYYAAEDVITGYWMRRSVFQVPGALGRVDPGGWEHVGDVGWLVVKLSIGLAVLFLGLLSTAPREAVGGRLDGALWLAFLAETALFVPLTLRSTGAWINYAMPSVVWGSILLARWLDRATVGARFGARAALFLAGALALLANDVRLVAISAGQRGDRGDLVMLLDEPIVRQATRDRLYFANLPQFNRLYGRADLAHDEWLYGNFEKLEEAEPRDRWLRAALTSTVRLVVVPATPPAEPGKVPGVSLGLPALGYIQVRQFGRYALWSRGGG